MRYAQTGVGLGIATVLLLAPLTGCRSAEQKDIDQAKQTVAATGQPEEVIATESNGNTQLTMVQPGAQRGAAPIVSSEVIPDGAASQGAIPDWSNGTHPAKGQAQIYTGPGMVATGAPAPAAPVAPGTQPQAAYAPNGAPAYGNTAPPNTQPAPGYAQNGYPNGQTGYPANGQPAYPANQQPGYGPNGQPQGGFEPTNVTIPAGTDLAIRINEPISVKASYAGQGFTGELADSVMRDGQVVLPRGTRFRGVVDAAHHRGRFKGASVLELRLTRLVYNGREYPIETGDFVERKRGKGKRTAGFIGGLGAAGALIGGLAGGGAGAVIGGVSGAGAGTGVAAFTGNRDIYLPAESLVRFRLRDSLTVQPAA